MILAIALKQLFPDADFLRDIKIQDDGQGAFIAEWNLPEAQPTQLALEAAWQMWIDGSLNRAKEAALSYLNTWRGERRAALGLTEAIYFEARRWQANQSSPLGLDSGRLSREVYTGLVISRRDKIEADYNLAVSLVAQANDEDTIAIILTRRI